MPARIVNTLLARIHRISPSHSLVAFRDLRKLYSERPKDEFDSLILSAARAELISLHATDYVADRTDTELAEYVFRPDVRGLGCGRHARGRYFIGCTIRLDN